MRDSRDFASGHRHRAKGAAAGFESGARPSSGIEAPEAAALRLEGNAPKTTSAPRGGRCC